MNLLYPTAKDLMLTGGLDMVTDQIVCVLVNENYTPQPYHVNLADIPATMRVAVSGTLPNRSVATGVFSADPLTVSGVYGDPIGALVMMKQTGAELTSTLVAFLDSSPSLPILPNGGDLIFNWDPGTFRIFAIVDANQNVPVPGPPGPQGSIGPAGPAGPQGPAGLDAVITLGTIPYSTNIAGAIAYDFSGSSYQTTTLEGPLHVSASNISAGADTTIRLINTSAGTYLVTYNPSFQWLGVAPPPSVAAGKSLFISLVSFGASASDVFGNFARQV